jgi:hypothetical protein
MPSTIPYDPALTLGSIVPQDKLDNIIQMAALQAPADAAQATLNAAIALKRSIDMTTQELINMGINPSNDMLQNAAAQGKAVADAATAYATARIESETKLTPLRAKILGVDAEIESPIDYNRSVLKQLPLAADSLQMNVQYFSYDKNTQTSQSHAATIAGFVSDSLNVFGDNFSEQASGSTSSQVNSQHSRHSIAGTLVICITCTHKTAQVFAPFILDVDKAVRSWNQLFQDNMIKTNDVASIAKIEAASETPKDKSFSILSGATYGSSFVGMVHVLNTSDTRSSQDMESVASSLQEQFQVGSWFATESGGFGVDSSFSDSAKSLLSTQSIQSHCSAITMGIIPSIKSNQVKLGVQQFADFDPGKEMQQLAVLQGATASDSNTVAASADAARTGQQMVTLKNSTITSALSSLADIDDGANRIIDINSLMTAMDDYIDKCISGGDNVGVPINYFLKPITQSMIARAWLAKYYPNKYNQAGAADDSGGGTGGGGTGGGGG